MEEVKVAEDGGREGGEVARSAHLSIKGHIPQIVVVANCCSIDRNNVVAS